MPIQSSRTIKNFSGLTSLDQVTAQLDFVFARLQDSLATNPSTISLLDKNQPVPQHQAGDFVLDYRNGDVTPGMSNGKTIEPIKASVLAGQITSAQHGQLPSAFFDSVGAVTGYMHEEATESVSGFFSATDKTRFDITHPASGIADVDASAGVVGVGNNYARSDHAHKVLTGSPVAVGTANAAGTSDNLSRTDHVHSHGAQTSGTLHAAVTSSVNGFMIAADKVELDRLNVLNIDGLTITGNHYIAITIGGTQYKVQVF